MKFFLLSICLLATTFSFSQDSFTSRDAKQVVDVFFEGFHKGDTILMKSVMTNDMMMQTVYANEDGENKLNTDAMDGFIKAMYGLPMSFGSTMHFYIVEPTLLQWQNLMTGGK